MAKFIKEPLVHFLILGGALFGLYSFLNDNPQEESTLENTDSSRFISKEIIITKNQIENLEARYKQTWKRNPTEQERSGLIDGYIRDEVMYRQALTLNLDLDDPSVRKRMRQKLEFLTNDIAALSPPEDDELQSYLNENAQKYRRDPEFTFTQLFFDKKKHGDTLRAEINTTLEKLPKGISDDDLRPFGDRTMLNQRMK